MFYTLERRFAKLLHIPERLVDGVGMYRVVTLSLVALSVLSLGASLLNWLAYSLQALLTALTIALGIGLGLNIILAKLWRITANHESAIITSLILFFMMIPSAVFASNWQLAAAVALGILSKYLLVYRKQHIVNPAAVGAVLVVVIIGSINLVGGTSYNTDIFSWWVANPTLFWPVLILGLLIVFKIRKWTPVLAFIGVGLTVFLIEEFRLGFLSIDSISLYFVSFPTLFLAFFMLTEPFTMPPTKHSQAVYGGLVGVLSSTTVFAPFLAMTPELALVLGNLFAYCFRIRQKLYLKLIAHREIATDTREYVFEKPDTFRFLPGQYLEWMLPHKGADSRGLRRYFTIASSPTESVLRLALKIMPEGGSTYKQKLATLDQGEPIIASQLSGDFLLPKDTTTKLGFIAGGIGVTPFSSQLRHMVDSGQVFDTVLYYCANTVGELAYKTDFQQMDLPLQVIPVIAKETVVAPDEAGFITVDMLDRRTPDWRERTWYLSGPPGMVNAYQALLRQAGLPRRQIETDFFPGLA